MKQIRMAAILLAGTLAFTVVAQPALAEEGRGQLNPDVTLPRVQFDAEHLGFAFRGAVPSVPGVPLSDAEMEATEGAYAQYLALARYYVYLYGPRISSALSQNRFPPGFWLAVREELTRWWRERR